MQNILITCAGRRNYLIQYFKDALNGTGLVIAADHDCLAPALADADIAVQVPNLTDSTYIPKLLEISKQHDVTAILSLNDYELPILSKNKAHFEKQGVKVIISNEEVITLCLDKWKTYQYLKKMGIHTPKTYKSLSSAIKAVNLGILKFPVILKPRWGSGSLGIESIESLKELKLAYQLKKLKLKHFHAEENTSQALIIQEKLLGKEFGMDIVNNLKGTYFGTFAREKIAMRSGETDRATSVIDDKFSAVGKTIAENLKHIGSIDCDIFLVDNQLYVLELNPRFGGGYPFSHESGINLVAILLEWLRGGNDVERYINYQAGMTFSKYDRLIKLTPLPTIDY